MHATPRWRLFASAGTLALVTGALSARLITGAVPDAWMWAASVPGWVMMFDASHRLWRWRESGRDLF